MRARRMLEVAAVHAALFIAIWLFSVMIYAVVFTHAVQVVWLVVDGVLVAGAVAAVQVWRDRLGFTALGPRRGAKLVAIVVFAIVCVLVCQLVIDDWNPHIAAARSGSIIPDGRVPYNIRWLIPFFAGRWNILPVDDIDAVKALNFGAFVVTGVGLVLLFVRLRIRLVIALFAPVFLLSSYLGVYGASNRLVLDAANYALFVLLFHTLLRTEHWPYFSAVLLVAGMNAEKAVYWMPVFVLCTLLREDSPWLVTSSQPGGSTTRKTRSRLLASKFPAAICAFTSEATCAWVICRGLPSPTVTEAWVVPAPAPYCFHTPVIPLFFTRFAIAPSLNFRSDAPAEVFQYAPRYTGATSTCFKIRPPWSTAWAASGPYPAG